MDSKVAEIIAADPHGPFPEAGNRIRCFHNGLVTIGTVARVWLNLDQVLIDVKPDPWVRLVLAKGDRWEPCGM